MGIIIVADDLTGAADSAARCQNAGLPAHIFLQPPTLPLPAGVVAISTDSRFLSSAEAASRVSALVAPLRGSQATWYKKIDSTLRGNIGAEVDAMLESIEATCAVICPAFPAQGRGLVDGSLRFAQAQDQHIHLPTLLASQTTRPLMHFSLADVQAGSAMLAGRLRAAHHKGGQLFVVDALTDVDLENLLAAQQRALPDALLCGSAGLIEPLARSQAPVAERSVGATAPPQLRAPILAVVGSGCSMAHRQIDSLRILSDIEICEVAEPAAIENECVLAAAGRRGLVLHQPRPEAGTILEGKEARARALQFTRAAAALAQEMAAQTLIIVGGDTAAYLLAHLGIQRLTVQAELMPGIPLLEGIDAMGRRRQIVTKAGNFGDETTLEQLVGRVAP